MKTAAWMFVIAIACPAAAAAQHRDARLDRLAAPLRAPLAAVLDSADHAGLPREPLIEKALEGTAKHASDAAILAAVRALAGALAQARAALGPGSTPDELSAAAVALRAGAQPADLTALRAARSSRSLVVPLAVLADLVARGVPADTATSVVLALAAHARDADYAAFRRSVDRDIDLGLSPAASAMGQLNASARAALLDAAKKP